MTEQEIFQLLGLAYFAVGLGAFLNPDYYRRLISSYLHTQPVIYLNGAIALFIGYWLGTYDFAQMTNMSWLVRTMGWISVFKGLLILILPNSYLDMAKSFRSSISLMTFEALFILILGVAMLWIGFK